MSRRSQALRIARERWFLIALALMLLVGTLGHTQLRPVADAAPRGWIVALVMFCTAAPMAFTSRLTGKHSRRSVALGVLLSAGVAPLLAWVASRLLTGALATGLIVVGMAPCTLASAAVWTRRGGGNAAAALLVTLITNFGCFLILPFWAWFLFDEGSGTKAPDLATRMLGMVVAPLCIAQLLRRVFALRMLIDMNRAKFNMVALCGLLSIVFVGAVNAGELLGSSQVVLGWSDWAMLLALVVVLHLVLFMLGWHTGRAIAPEEEALAVAVSGSQKTLTVGLDVALSFGGLAILPMLIYHAAQLLIDEVLVEKLGPKK